MENSKKRLIWAIFAMMGIHCTTGAIAQASEFLNRIQGCYEVVSLNGVAPYPDSIENSSIGVVDETDHVQFFDTNGQKIPFLTVHLGTAENENGLVRYKTVDAPLLALPGLSSESDSQYSYQIDEVIQTSLFGSKPYAQRITTRLNLSQISPDELQVDLAQNYFYQVVLGSFVSQGTWVLKKSDCNQRPLR